MTDLHEDENKKRRKHSEQSSRHQGELLTEKKSKREKYDLLKNKLDGMTSETDSSTSSHDIKARNSKKRTAKNLHKLKSELTSVTYKENKLKSEDIYDFYNREKHDIRAAASQMQNSFSAKINGPRLPSHVQKFVNSCVPSSDRDVLNTQEMSLESMGYYNEILPWESMSIPKRRELQSAIYERVTNHINPDIILVIDNHEFYCHRIVLQSYSEYFDSISNLEHQPSFHVNEKVTRKAFIAVYSWMLSEGQGGLNFIKKSNILEVLIAAEVLLIKDLEEQCHAFLDSKEAFSEENAFFVFMDASFWKKSSIKDLMVPRIQKFFLPLVSSWDFTQLNVEDLCIILKSNFIVIHCELEVFMAAVRWLKTNWDERKKHLNKIMKCVRFGLMNPVQLVDIRKNPESPEFLEITTDKNVQLMIEDGLAYAVEFTLSGGSLDHENRCDLLKLLIPEQRNFAKTNKDYKSYQHFLEYLDEIRKDLSSFKIETRPENSEKSVGFTPDATQFSTETKLGCTTRPSLTNILYGKNQAADNESQLGACGDSIYTCSTLVSKTPSVESRRGLSPFRRVTLKESAAVVIQSTFRGYRVRSKIHQLPENSEREISSKTEVEAGGSVENRQDASTNCRKENVESFSKLNDKSTTSLSQFSNSKQTILIFEGLSPCQKNNQVKKSCVVFRYDEINNNWDVISHMPKPRYYHGVAKLRSKIYIVGGKNQEDEHQTMCTESLSFDPFTLQWKEEPPLNTPRQSFGITTLHGFLYVIGGEANKRVLSSVERYNPGTKMWEEVKPLPEPCLGVAACCYDNHIWVVGGMNNYKQQISSQVYCYDPEEDVWIKKTPLRYGRAFSSLVSHNGVLYLVGGATSEDNRIVSVDAIDVWDVKTLSWKLKVNMPVPRHGHTVVFLENKMIIIGGTSTQYARTLNHVDICCMKTGSWSKKIKSLQTSIIGHCSVNLQLNTKDQ
ncbi:kelch-like protein 40b isoform X3 [Cimex lectularius]|uniref:BTB domain-containing protein n=1 Tax=Cimex lectularius TaxID=79782 RepID=A0A8I6R7R1_CIMLE|nr:kelch-like protein 40b isoform X3 [Cimex lectularius]